MLSTQQLAHEVFVNNRKRRIIDLNLLDARTTTDVFICCLDLFCRGLVLTSPTAEAIGHVRLQDITDLQLQEVCLCMQAAGISPCLHAQDSSHVTHHLPAHQPTNLPELMQQQHAAKVEDMVLLVRITPNILYSLSFHLFHPRLHPTSHARSRGCSHSPVP
jgi:hypothetical protein